MPTLRQRRTDHSERFSFTDYVQWVTSGTAAFPTSPNYLETLTGSPTEKIGDDFASYVQKIYKRNGIVAACMAARESMFAEISFRFASVNAGKIGSLFGTDALAILERPFGPNSTTGQLAVRMIQDADLGGQFYGAIRHGRLWRRRPDKVLIVLDGDPNEDEFVSINGFSYYPGGIQPGGKFFTYLPQEIVHWAPKPDPDAEYRGMSWLTPVLREIQSDGAATDHKLEFFDNAATPNMVVKTPADVMTNEQFEKFRAQMNANHVGRGNRHKTLYLVPGADVTVVGKDFQQMEFSEIQGRDEDRIASAAGVPAVIVGLKESLQGSSLNAGNYAQARRRFADITMRPLYRSAAGALELASPPPTNGGPAKLWYDDSGIAAFREDRKDAADIQSVKAATIHTHIVGGWEPDSARAAVDAEDNTLLVHTGLFSIQLQEAGSPKLPQPGADPAKTPAE